MPSIAAFTGCIPSFACALIAVMSLTGCETYQPLPPDLGAHRAGFLTRDPGGAAVRDYLRELAAMNGERVTTFDVNDGISLDEAEVVALVFNTQLRVARLKAKVSLAGAGQADRWDDPEFDFELLRVIESTSKPWVLASSLALTIPISGRLAAQKSKAVAEADVELRRAHELEWQTLATLREAWLTWSATRQRIALTEKYLSPLDDAARIAEQQRRFGKIGSTDERVFHIERALRRGDLATDQAEARAQELQIKALLGLAPSARITLVPSLPVDSPDASPNDDAALLAHPRLKLAAAEYEVAEQALRLAIRKQYPDLKIGPAGEWDEGDWKAGLSLSVPIPILNANKREIAEAKAGRDAQLAALEAEYEALMHEAAAARERLDAARARRTHIETQVAPLVDQQISDLSKQAGLGELDALLMLDALQRVVETRKSALAARLEEATASAALRALFTPAPTTPVLRNLSTQERTR